MENAFAVTIKYAKSLIHENFEPVCLSYVKNKLLKIA